MGSGFFGFLKRAFKFYSSIYISLDTNLKKTYLCWIFLNNLLYLEEDEKKTMSKTVLNTKKGQKNFK